MNYSTVLQLGWGGGGGRGGGGRTGAGTIFLHESVRCVCASVGPIGRAALERAYRSL